jgi:hypothetical protein
MQQFSFSNWRFSLAGLNLRMDGLENRIWIFLALRILAEIASGFTAFVIPGPAGMTFTNPTPITEAFS